jgi:hypothetical protein
MPKHPFKDFKHLGRAQCYKRLNSINGLNGPEIIKSTATPEHLIEKIEHENSLDDFNITSYESDIKTISSESEI